MRNDTKPRRAFCTVLFLWIVGFATVVIFAAALAVNSESAEAPRPVPTTEPVEAPVIADFTVAKKTEAPAILTAEPKVSEAVSEAEPEILPATSEPSTPETLEYVFFDDIPLDGELQRAMQEACEKYGVPFELAVAVAEAESTFDPDADNGLCVGLMQINRVNFDWLRGLGIDPETHEGNIEAGVYILSGHLKSYEDWNLALMAYNCGAKSAKKQWDKGYTSSRYSRSVVARAQSWSTVINNTKST